MLRGKWNGWEFAGLKVVGQNSWNNFRSWSIWAVECMGISNLTSKDCREIWAQAKSRIFIFSMTFPLSNIGIDLQKRAITTLPLPSMYSLSGETWT